MMGETALKTDNRVKESDLVRRILDGDERAFGELVHTFQRPVINLAWRLVGSEQAAQDIAQDVFLKAYRELQNFRKDSQLWTWLYRITVNTAISYQRKRRWETVFSLLESNATRTWQADDHTRPDVEAERRDQWDLIQKALQRLPANQRAVVVLHRWEGLSHQEIADILGITVSAVESRIHRAYKNLSRWLSKLLEEK